jgi:hypothetical protein
MHGMMEADMHGAVDRFSAAYCLQPFPRQLKKKEHNKAQQ